MTDKQKRIILKEAKKGSTVSNIINLIGEDIDHKSISYFISKNKNEISDGNIDHVIWLNISYPIAAQLIKKGNTSISKLKSIFNNEKNLDEFCTNIKISRKKIDKISAAVHDYVFPQKNYRIERKNNSSINYNEDRYINDNQLKECLILSIFNVVESTIPRHRIIYEEDNFNYLIYFNNTDILIETNTLGDSFNQIISRLYTSRRTAASILYKKAVALLSDDIIYSRIYKGKNGEADKRYSFNKYEEISGNLNKFVKINIEKLENYTNKSILLNDILKTETEEKDKYNDCVNILFKSCKKAFPGNIFPDAYILIFEINIIDDNFEFNCNKKDGAYFFSKSNYMYGSLYLEEGLEEHENIIQDYIINFLSSRI